MTAGCLYLVATPIGNLEDLSPRAQRLLAEVGLIAAEDTRHSRKLLQNFAIQTSLVALHDHNEAEAVPGLLRQMLEGLDVAVISDAGTPLVSDPGYKLVRAARAGGIQVISIPGPSAVLAGLCVSGLPSDRFVFEGFLPAKQVARQARIRELAADTRSLILFESCHRIVASVGDLLHVLGPERRVCVARELTKLHEESHTAPLAELPGWLAADPNRRRGEFVLVVEGSSEAPAQHELDSLLAVLLDELPAGKAARIAARLTDQSRSDIYSRIQQIKGGSEPDLGDV